jgi:hypothetical protein
MANSWQAKYTSRKHQQASLPRCDGSGGGRSRAEHGFPPWRFEWPWLHNVNQPYLHWLDPNMPGRNG